MKKKSKITIRSFADLQAHMFDGGVLIYDEVISQYCAVRVNENNEVVLHGSSGVGNDLALKWLTHWHNMPKKIIKAYAPKWNISLYRCEAFGSRLRYDSRIVYGGYDK